MATIKAFNTTSTACQHRLRAVVKRPVLDLGYLEHCLTERLEDNNISDAVADLGTVIDCLNGCLAD